MKGGGTREISVPIESSYVEVLRIMKEVYFPDGMSTFGDEDIMTFKVGNFKAEEVQEQYTHWQSILLSTNLPKLDFTS